MVQLPERVSNTHYATIADIGRERIKRLIGEMKASTQLLDNKRKGAFGFRTFALDQSNFRIWDANASDFRSDGAELDLHVRHIVADSKPEDILYELLLKAGFPLTTRAKALTLAGKQVFSIQDGALLICLEKEITSELVDALAEADPLQVICLDEGFQNNDQLKANAVQTFRARAEAAESEIVFRTV